MTLQQHDSTILITGGTGFAGSHLVKYLITSGVPAASIHITTHSQTGGRVSELLPGSNTHQLDLLDPVAVARLFQSLQPHQVFHLASIARTNQSFSEARTILNNNIALYLNVLESVRDYSPKSRVLCVSSAEVYQPSQDAISELQPLDPQEPYGVSKVTQEFLVKSFVKAYQLDCIIVRPFNHIGEGQTPHFVVPAMAQQIVRVEQGLQSAVQVGNLSSIRDFTDVKDMVTAYAILMNQGESGQVYNAGSGRGVSIQSILDSLIELAQVPIPIEVDPSRMRPVDVPYSVADPSRLRALGWSAEIPLSETLARILMDWRSRT